jgi:ligand-binding SRPBCC domain-containing protein
VLARVGLKAYLKADDLTREISFTHTHEFRQDGSGTLVVDVFRYRSPLGVVGFVADKLFLERYMARFLRERAAFLKRAAEDGL